MTVFVCVSVREHISETTCPIFAIFVHLPVASSDGVAIGYALPIFMDDVMFAHA